MIDPLATENRGKIKTTTRNSISKYLLVRLHLYTLLLKKDKFYPNNVK